MEQRLAEITAKAEQRKKRTESLILLQNFIQAKPPPARDNEAPAWLIESLRNPKKPHKPTCMM